MNNEEIKDEEIRKLKTIIESLEASIERISELPPTYFCDPDKNTECRKTACFKNGGPCQMTFNKSCAAYVDDKAPEPVNYKEVSKNER